MPKPTDYKRSLAAARKLIETRTAAVAGFVGLRGLTARLNQVDLDDLPEETHKHHAGYVGALMEFAAQHAQGYRSGRVGGGDDEEKEVDRNDPRAFARYFLEKRPEYSRTKNGLAAMLLESWLMESSGYLYSRFVETVLEKDGKFLAIFEGKLNREELRRMRTGTAPFMQFEQLVAAGDTNGQEIFEFTLFDCTAIKRGVSKAEPDLRADHDDTQDNGDVKFPGGTSPRFESLMPSAREDYEAVCAEGGLRSNVLVVVLGEAALDTIVEGPRGRQLVDPNGVTWTEDAGQCWLPDVGSLDESTPEEEITSQEPRNYRKWQLNDDPGNCAHCRFYRLGDEAGEYECELFDYYVEPEMTCDEWGVRQEGLAETRAVASDFGTWEIHEEADHSIVSIGEQAWVVPQTFDEVLQAVAEVGRMYGEDLAAERDLTAEAILTDFTSECGVVCERPAPLAESRVLDRDQIVEAANAVRLAAAGTEPLPQAVQAMALTLSLEEAKRLWDKAAAQVTDQYRDVPPETERWHHLAAGLFKSLARVDDAAADDGKPDDKGRAAKKT